MISETVLFAVRVGNEDWQEELITAQAARIEAAKVWALANGFNRLRVATINLSKPPNFAATLNTKRRPTPKQGTPPAIT